LRAKIPGGDDTQTTFLFARLPETQELFSDGGGPETKNIKKVKTLAPPSHARAAGRNSLDFC